MKTPILIKTVAALAIGAAFPLGAIAAQPAKTMTERGVIEKVSRLRESITSRAIGWNREAEGDLRVERLDAARLHVTTTVRL
jgi:hypothetical protein